MAENDNLGYDEQAAVKFIRATLPEAVNAQYDDDQILYVIDIIWDWYERHGYLSLDMSVTDEEELNIDDLTEYVKKELARDGEFEGDTKDIGLIVRGELQYEESIDPTL